MCACVLLATHSRGRKTHPRPVYTSGDWKCSCMLLQVDDDCTPEELKQAYRGAAKVCCVPFCHCSIYSSGLTPELLVACVSTVLPLSCLYNGMHRSRITIHDCKVRRAITIPLQEGVDRCHSSTFALIVCNHFQHTNLSLCRSATQTILAKQATTSVSCSMR